MVSYVSANFGGSTLYFSVSDYVKLLTMQVRIHRYDKRLWRQMDLTEKSSFNCSKKENIGMFKCDVTYLLHLKLVCMEILLFTARSGNQQSHPKIISCPGTSQVLLIHASTGLRATVRQVHNYTLVD